MVKNILKEKLVPDTILTDKWYVDQLGLLLKKSVGVPAQIHLYMDLVRDLNDKELYLFNLLGKYDENANKWHLNISEIEKIDSEKSDILDKIANIFGLQRSYSLWEQGDKDANSGGSNNYVTITLNNEELYSIIYAKVMRNNYDGTMKMAREMYNELKEITLGKIEIAIISDSEATATSNLYLNTTYMLDENANILDEYKNIMALFKNGFYDIKSMGISYNKAGLPFGQTLVWAPNDKEGSEGSRYKWDEFLWG